jgi:DNA-directed RNA polymerase subunit alpha
MMSYDPLDTVIGASSARQRDPEQCSKFIAAAREAREAGDHDATIDLYRKALGADSYSPVALFELAFALDLVGEEDEAISLYERCAEQAPAHVNALINLAVLYEDRTDYSRAERCLKQVLETNPNNERARLFMKDVQASREMRLDESLDRDLIARKAMFDTPVTDFELSVRARTCLKKMNIRTLGELLRYTESELMSYKNFGESSLDEIKIMLEERNLRLGQGLEDVHRSARRQITDKLKGTGKEVMLAKPVTDLKLSVRARKALQLLDIQSLGDLVSHTEAELMGVKNFGATSLVEVRERLVELGLGLRTLEDE